MARVICAIGCGTFEDEDLDPLPGAIEDAKTMFSLLTDSSLGAAQAEAPSILVPDPTQDELLTTLGTFFQGANLIGADAIVYFSGHAVPLLAGGWGFFCRDSRAQSPTISTLSFRDLEASWHGSGTQRCMFIIDTCYARAAVPAEFRTKRSSTAVVRSPRATEEGLALIWSSTETSESFDVDERSIFCTLFQEGLRAGFDLQPFKPFVRASEAVQWIQTEAETRVLADFGAASPEFETKKLADFVRVSCSELGVTDSLFLSKNPRYDESASATLAPETVLQLETRQTTLQRMQALASIADSYRTQRPRFEVRRSTVSTPLSVYLRFDPVTNTEICLIPTKRRGVVVSELLLWPKLFMVLIPLLIAVGTYGGRSGLLCTYDMILAISTIRIFLRRKEWRSPLKHFLLVTRDGLYEQRGDSVNALLWSCVGRVAHDLLHDEIITRTARYLE